MDGAAHHRIEQGGGDAAVDAAQRVIVVEHRLVAEHHAAELDLGHAKAERLRDRRRRQPAGQHFLKHRQRIHGARLFQRYHAKAGIAGIGGHCHLRRQFGAYTRFGLGWSSRNP